MQSLTIVGASARVTARVIGIIVVLAAIFPLFDIAFAHDESGGGAGFVTGLFHPVLGFDHFLAMLSVGVISAQIGGRAIWYIPATFVLAMILGGILGMQSVNILAVEAGIALSVLILGSILAAGKVMPEWIAVIAVGIFGIFHGHAHGTEMPLIADPWLYGAGFVIGTSLIHLTGVLFGIAFRGARRGDYALRAAGVGIAAAGAYIFFTL